MGRAGVRVDGELVVVEYPKGATETQIKALARQQQARRGPKPLPTAAPATEGPDVVGRAKEWLTRTPATGEKTKLSRALFGETIGGIEAPGRLVRSAGRLFLPETVPEAARFAATLPIGGGIVSGPLMRTGAGALAGSVAKVAQTGDPSAAGWEGVSEGLSQLAGEALPGALRFGLIQRAGRKAISERAGETTRRTAAHEADVKLRDAKIAYDTAMDKAVTQLEKEGYTRDVAVRRAKEAANVREARARYQDEAAAAKRAFGEAEAAQKAQHEAATAAATERHAADVRAYEARGATSIADAFKQQVPAFKDFPSNEAGLLDMVYGQGQQRLSARFDEAMKEVIALGRGQQVSLSIPDAQALRLPTDQIVQQADKALPDLVRVDAGQLAQAATGFWKKDHGVYRRAVAALDKADIGDPASRAEYKAGQALIQFADQSRMLKGERFNPEAARSAFTTLKRIDELRKRGQGDIFRGPIAEAVRAPAPELRLPPEPAPLRQPIGQAFRRPAPLPAVPEPPRRAVTTPPEIPPLSELSAIPEGVTVKTLPKFSFWEGAAIAEIPFLLGALATGQHTPAGYGYGLPFAAGGLAAKALSGRPIVTEAPLSAASRFATGAGVTGMGAQEARRLMGAP